MQERPPSSGGAVGFSERGLQKKVGDECKDEHVAEQDHEVATQPAKPDGQQPRCRKAHVSRAVAPEGVGRQRGVEARVVRREPEAEIIVDILPDFGGGSIM